MKLNWSIRHKLIGGFSLVLLLIVAVSIYSVIFSRGIERETHFMSETAAMNVDIVEKLRVAAIQVQQLITDSSATGAYDGINESEKWAEKFRNYVKEMHIKCNVCHKIAF